MNITGLMEGIAYELVQGSTSAKISSIAIDNRRLEAGGLFVCLRGLQADGHRFINNAVESGAAAILIDKDLADYPRGVSVIKVEDTRKALPFISSNFYNNPAKNLRLTGVTGTNGKTSVTYMMESVLRQIGKPALIGTVGLRIGGRPVDIKFATSTTPDPQELHQMFDVALKNGVRDLVMEVSSHALALHKIDGLFYEAAIFTNLTQDHLDFHGSMENYLRAKAELFKKCRYGIVNIDDKYSPEIMGIGSCEKWFSYGIENPCDIRAENITESEVKSAFDVLIGGKSEHFILPVPARFNIYNALAVIAAAYALGIDICDIREGLANFEGVPGRIQPVKNAKGFQVFVDYAHSPDGLSNIIGSVKAFTTGRVITLFGCGGDRDVTKRPIMGRIAGELSDYCIITSDNPRSEDPEEIIRQIEPGMKETPCPYITDTDRRQAIYKGIAMLKQGDSFIIAGKGHENYQIINGKVIDFDDAEIAKEALEQW